MEIIVNGGLIVAGIYLIAGLVFSIYFLSKWINKLDESAEGSSTLFKTLILPGVILFWPYLAKKIITNTDAS